MNDEPFPGQRIIFRSPIEFDGDTGTILFVDEDKRFCTVHVDGARWFAGSVHFYRHKPESISPFIEYCYPYDDDRY